MGKRSEYMASQWDTCSVSRHTMEQFVKMAHQDIYTNKQLRLAIDKKPVLTAPAETVGYIDLFEFEPAHRRAGVGILVGKPDARRKGIALESLNLISEYAFNVLHLHQIYCHIHVNNEASIRLFSAAGFLCTGEFKDWTLINGSWTNVYFMQKVSHLL
ncbi:MAG: GNAT family N-acetyltransferase [Bacteroidetes bacterium]|nr:GNAT family N-acetyltransferase [Bacteroidota bacterium]